jgi:uncharacterized protein (TIGR03435 family)
LCEVDSLLQSRFPVYELDMVRTSIRLCLLTLGIGYLFGSLAANATYTQADAALEFDVASVKRTEPSLPAYLRVFPGRLSARSMPLRAIVLRAFNIPAWKLIDTPEWIDEERFDIDATIPQPASAENVRAMLRTLLERRFRFSVQAVTRQLDSDVLVQERDGRLGPGMHPVEVDCSTDRLKDGSAPGLFPAESRLPCGEWQRTMRISGGQVGNIRRAKYSALTMDDFANILAGLRGRPVINKTAIVGQFDIELEYVSDQIVPPTATGQGQSTTPSNRASLVNAVREQLNLALRSERLKVELMSVRSVGLPDEN